MQATMEFLEAEALKLTFSERARLAEKLIASLDEDGEVEQAWAIEVDRCITEIDTGRDRLMPASEAIARARHALE